MSPSVRPSIRVRTGSTSLHPAAERTVAGGLRSGGREETFVAVAPASSATDLAGPEPSLGVIEALERAETDRDDDDRLVAVVQLRSSPEAPRWLAVRGVEWRSPRTLELTAAVDDWDVSSATSTHQMDSAHAERERPADDVVATGVWTLSPSSRPRRPPTRAVLALE